MRKMIGESMDEQGSINVIEHIMLKNMWEYYFIEDAEDVNPEGYATALVMGFETEVGSVYMPEIEPYIFSRTTCLQDIMPPAGWSWVTDEEARKFLKVEK